MVYYIMWWSVYWKNAIIIEIVSYVVNILKNLTIKPSYFQLKFLTTRAKRLKNIITGD